MIVQRPLLLVWSLSCTSDPDKTVMKEHCCPNSSSGETMPNHYGSNEKLFPERKPLSSMKYKA